MSDRQKMLVKKGLLLGGKLRAWLGPVVGPLM
jgi:hypothetical protein